MSIDDDAAQVRRCLAEYGKDPGDPDIGRHALDGTALSQLSKLGANRLNDAVELLEEHGHVEVRSFIGTHPYDFGEVSLTARGRREAEAESRAVADSGTAEPASLGALSDNRFTLSAKLGEGTFGEVWRATDHELKREVAVKFVLAPGEQDALAHAKALARVTHPNIVTVFDTTTLTNPATDAASRAVVMELVNGTPLVELIGPSLSPGHVRRIGFGLLDALEAYHGAGLAHLDVHDGNVMVSENSIKLLDPLYYETSMFFSATRDKQQSRDVRQARDVLVQMINSGSIPEAAALVFNQTTVRPSLELLRQELGRALTPAGAVNAAHSVQLIAPHAPPDDVRETKHRELRTAYVEWFVQVRSWLNATFDFGLRLESTGDPLTSLDGTMPKLRRRLEAAKLQVLFLDQAPKRITKVKELSAAIGYGGPKPRTTDQHRAFGTRIISVVTARLKVLADLQGEVAEWLSGCDS